MCVSHVDVPLPQRRRIFDFIAYGVTEALERVNPIGSFLGEFGAS